MELEKTILSEFAKVVHDQKDTSNVNNKYVRGTAKNIDGKKYVQIDGSTLLTPISETVDIDDGDRVLVSIENHIAMILGNFSFPPSARREQVALEKSEEANESANIAKEKAKEATQKAEEAVDTAFIASENAKNAINNANIALNASNEVKENLNDAVQKATQASKDAKDAKEAASEAESYIANAKDEINKITEEIGNVQGNINQVLDDVRNQGEEIEVIKEEYSTKVEAENIKAELSTEIITKIGELQTNITETYYSKTDIVEMQGELQSQITQNANGIKTQSKKIEKLESDTEEAQKQIDEALEKSSMAEVNADRALDAAKKAQEIADKAKESAEFAETESAEATRLAGEARENAIKADKALSEARTALDEAWKNYELIASNPDSTEEEINTAELEVLIAEDVVKEALESASEAEYIAREAEDASEQAKIDALQAQTISEQAQKKADAAKIVADKAKADAEAAQKVISDLTHRLTEAETTIEQNSESISLTSQKTNEIGDNLINNYYSKTDMDAKLVLQSGSIMQEVSNIYTAKDDFNEKIDDITTAIFETKGSIETTADGIVMEALKHYTKTDDFESYQEEVESRFELLPNQLELDFTQKIQNVANDLNETNAKVNDINKHFTFNTDGMEIGAADSDNKLLLDNDEMAIMVKGNKVQYFDANGRGHIPNLSVSDTVNLLGLIITKDSDGRINFDYV